MTLVEMIVTVLVFSIAALILATGFSTVIRYMGEAALIKNTGNEVYSIIESEKDKSITNKKVNIKITIEDESKNKSIIEDDINMNIAEKKISEEANAYKIRFTKLSKDEVYVDTTLTFYEEVKAIMNGMSKPGLDLLNGKGGYNELYEKLVAENANCIEYVKTINSMTGFGNTSFVYYYMVVGREGKAYPTLNDKIVEKCNEIFEETKGALSEEKSKSIKFGNNAVYMKPLYIPNMLNYENELGKGFVLLVADTQPYNPQVEGQWKTRLIYVPGEDSWYYKIYTKPVGEPDYLTSKYFRDVTFLKDQNSWDEFLKELQLSNEWRKIEID